MIRLQNVTKEYLLDGEKFFALRSTNLEIKPGEFCAIVGPSGSGKSTLMHLIGLLDQPSSGKIFIEEKDVSRLSDNNLSSLRNRFVGFVFQQFNLLNKLTVQENIMLPTIYAKQKLDFDPQQRAQELMSRFGILEKARSFPNRISGGQQQRVAIARALITSPKLVLADEPTGNLDTKTGDKIMDLLAQLNKEDGITVVIVTHEADVARRARRQIHIKDGQIIK